MSSMNAKSEDLEPPPEREHQQQPGQFATLAIHAGEQVDKWGMKQVISPISLSTIFKYDAAEMGGEAKEYVYSRIGNPNRHELETKLAAMDGAKYCRAFATSYSSLTALVNCCLKTGDHILCAEDAYEGNVLYLLKVPVAKHGIELSFANLTGGDTENALGALESALKPNTRMVLFESPTNPLLKVVDIAAVSRAVKAYSKEILVVVDNTLMTPYFQAGRLLKVQKRGSGNFQQPLSLGADVVVYTLSKGISGHFDVLVGAITTNDVELDQQLGTMQRISGAVPSPFESYLACRGIKTLHLRMKQQSESALAIADWLQSHHLVGSVSYPALPTHPQHSTHTKQARGMSGVVSFNTVRGGVDGARFLLSKLRLFTLAMSFGGCESLAQLPALMTHGKLSAEEKAKIGITDNLVRLSVGCEDVNDLLVDLKQAFLQLVTTVPSQLRSLD